MLAHCAYAIREMTRAAVAQVVAVDAGDHDIAELEIRDGTGEVERLLGIRRQRLAVRHVAERAASRAEIAEYHEGGGALAEALADVRAGSFLAHGMEAVFAEDALDFVKA